MLCLRVKKLSYDNIVASCCSCATMLHKNIAQHNLAHDVLAQQEHHAQEHVCACSCANMQEHAQMPLRTRARTIMPSYWHHPTSP